MCMGTRRLSGLLRHMRSARRTSCLYAGLQSAITHMALTKGLALPAAAAAAAAAPLGKGALLRPTPAL